MNTILILHNKYSIFQFFITISNPRIKQYSKFSFVFFEVRSSMRKNKNICYHMNINIPSKYRS